MRSQLLFCLMLAGCASTAPSVVQVDSVRTLKAGEMAAWKLEPGLYQLELTASHDGVRLEWPGAACAHGRGVKQLNTRCELRQSGQLVVENPSLLNLGLGQAVSISVRVTRLPEER